MFNNSVRVKCPFCGQVFECAAQYIATEEKCPSCGKRFRLTVCGDSSASAPNCLACYFGMFRRYFGFRGRTRRREFWWAFLFNAIATFVVAVLDGMCFGAYDDRRNMLVGIYFLVSLIPFSALQVRRLHDTNKSGWWMFLSLLPVLNIAYLVWLATDGDKGDNRFGKDPKAMA